MEARIVRRIDTGEELTLDVEVEAAVTAELAEQAYAAAASHRKVALEPGESPKDACDRVLGEKEAGELASFAAMSMSFPFARSQAEDAVTVGFPTLVASKPIVAGKPFAYMAKWAKLPQAELQSYEPVTITALPGKSPEEAVDEQISAMLASNARLEKSGEVRPIASGDAVMLALRVTLDGDEVPGLCFDERAYTTGVGAMPDGFEQNIVGMTPGEEKSFSFEGIADFDEDERPVMKTYEAHAKLDHLLTSVAPELTDAWVAQAVPGCSTVQDLRDAIRRQVEGGLENERRHYLNYLAASELAKRFTGKIPDAAYEAMRDELQEQFDREAESLGLTREQYMRRQGTNEQQHSVRMILQIRERLAQSIALDALARHFEIEVDETDMDEFFRASSPEGSAAELKRQMEASGRMYLAREGARRLKANDYLVEHATIVEAGS